MAYLLNTAYLVLLILLAPSFIYQAVRKGKYRDGWAEKFLGRAPRRASGRKCVWLHAVSVGEVNLLAPLLKELARRRPDWECVISTTTKTGHELARTRYPHLNVFYCPLDFSWAVSAAMRRVRPDLLALAELELWPNLIAAARRQGARVAIINGRLSERSFRGYRRIRLMMRRLFRSIDLVAAQNEEYAQRFCALGADPAKVHVTGSIKFDGAQTDRKNLKTQALAALAGFADDDVVLLAGSTQAPEERLALDTYQSLRAEWPTLRLALVPRHPQRFAEVAELLDRSGVAWQRRTALDQAPAHLAARVLLVDTVGELGAWWGTAHIALVGGSLSQRGGQNMIEPAAYGAAVCFGPNTWNFRDIVSEMLAHEAAVVVRDGAEFTAFVRRVLEDCHFAQGLGARAAALVAGQLGATARTTDLLEALLPDSDQIRAQQRDAA